MVRRNNSLKTFKDALRSLSADAALAKRLASKFLIRSRVSSHDTKDASMSQLIIGRVPRTKLDLMQPKIVQRLRVWQDSDKTRFDFNADTLDFAVPYAVISCN